MTFIKSCSQYLFLDHREVLTSIRGNLLDKHISEDRVELWRTVPHEELEEVACNKGDRKLRAAKRPQDSDPPVDFKQKEEKTEKKNVKAIGKRRQV
jgi:hypothetical protein